VTRLRVASLSVDVRTSAGPRRAVDGLSLSVSSGEILAVVGESGSGKSLSMLAMLGLLPAGATRHVERLELGEGQGRVDLAALSDRELRPVRGRRLGAVFQETAGALHPLLRLETQLVEGLVAHGLAEGAEARRRALAALERVGLTEARARLRGYSHELSGGQRQRVLLAMALLLEPEVLLADEPTSALDVSVQAEILRVLAEERARGLGVVLVTHDLGAVARLADRVLVLYAGRVVEEGPAPELLAEPRHPYTRALLACVPRLDGPPRLPRGIPGRPPQLGEAGDGCAFRSRCELASPRCELAPPLVRLGARAAACHEQGAVTHEAASPHEAGP
jgi:oligopeptide/dipeptide ABC transporter ATP-binding protein